MISKLLVLVMTVPTWALAEDVVALPRKATELYELKMGDTLTLPETRLDKGWGMRPFTTRSMSGWVPGVKGCEFTLYDTGTPTLLNSKTVWTVEKAAAYVTRPRRDPLEHVFVVMKDSAGRKGKLTCFERYRAGVRLHRKANISDFQGIGSTFDFKDEVLPSTALPKSARDGRG